MRVDCGMSSRREVSWPITGLWNVAKEKMLEDRGALPTENGYQLRECKALYVKKFLSRWLREDVEEEKAEVKEAKKEAEEAFSKSWKREVEKRRKRRSKEDVCSRFPVMF